MGGHGDLRLQHSLQHPPAPSHPFPCLEGFSFGHRCGSKWQTHTLIYTCARAADAHGALCSS